VRNFARAALRTSHAHLPVIVATLIVGALCVFAEPLYSENDDCFFTMAGSGFGQANHPEPHLVFSHFGYGLILVALSRLIGPNAHGWATIFSIWLSLVLTIRASLRAHNAFITWASIIVNIGCVFLGALISAEFTITAGLLFSAAIVSWLVSTTEERRSPFLRSLLIFALFFCCLLRSESFLMGLVIVLPSLVFLWFERKDLSRTSGILAFALVLIAVVTLATDKLAYWMSPEWRGVPEYNELRAQFVDYHRVPWSPEAPEYRQVGWSLNDYTMFNMWYMRSPIYDGRNLSLLVEKLGISPSATALTQMRDWFLFPFSSLPLLLTLIAQLLVALVLSKGRLWVGILTLLGECVAISAAGITGREPLVYVWNAAAGITLMTLFGWLITSFQVKGSLLRNVGLALISVLGLVTAAAVSLEHIGVCREAAAYRAWVNQNSQYFRGKVTVWDTGLVWQWLITPTRIWAPFPELKVASIDDINRMPIETDMLKELGIDDLAKAICTDPEMHLIADVGHPDALVPFCQEHYGIAPVFKEVARWGSTGIYVLDTQEAHLPSSD
jgi:hypothetical protein